jgi:hypothetical protein
MLVHIATTDLSTVVMILDQLESLEGVQLRAVLMPTWGQEGGRPVFENRYATNAYLLLEVQDRETAMKWWEEWADCVRTDLKTPFPDEEYAWIEPQLKARQ